jgi:hypothetical protein
MQLVPTPDSQQPLRVFRHLDLWSGEAGCQDSMLAAIPSAGLSCMALKAEHKCQSLPVKAKT